MSKLVEYMNKPTLGYYSGFNGLELKGLEYGIEDYAHWISGAWGGKGRKYHRLKIYYNKKGDAYCKLHGYKIPFDEVIRDMAR